MESNRAHSGDRLRSLLLSLKQKKITRKKFAEMCGVNTVTINLWYEMEEFGDVVWNKIAPVLGKLEINPDYLRGTSKVVYVDGLDDPDYEQKKFRKDVITLLQEIRDKLP